MSAGWDPGIGAYPLPPMNGKVVSPYKHGMHDIRWDDPSILGGNTTYSVVGVNIYRSDASDRGPYRRVNEYPLGGGFYRDQTDNVRVEKELVQESAWVFKGNAPNTRRFVFRTLYPCVKQNSTTPFSDVVYANTPNDVTVYVNGVAVPVNTVFGRTGEITLINIPEYDVTTEKEIRAPVPNTPDVVVEVSYWANKNFVVSSGLEHNTFYRLTTVVLDSTTPSGYNETPLGYAEPISLMQVETLDYIWRRAIQMNQWIVQQGGELVKFFVRKISGTPCQCRWDARTLEFGKMPENRCPLCFGTGLLGGFEGPYDILTAPDDADRRIAQSMYGRNKEHQYEVWIGPTPIVTQRDFLVKQTNERYVIGPVRRPSNRGNVLQQHFTMAYLDEGDIRYSVPIDGTDQLQWPGSRSPDFPAPPRAVNGSDVRPPWANQGAPWPEGPNAQAPMATDKANIPSERQVRGRTKVWEDQNY